MPKSCHGTAPERGEAGRHYKRENFGGPVLRLLPCFHQTVVESQEEKDPFKECSHHERPHDGYVNDLTMVEYTKTGEDGRLTSITDHGVTSARAI